jgi:hypothetical protein
MAISAKELREKLETAEFSAAELNAIHIMESYIDKQIREKYDGGEVRIELSYFNFNWNPKDDRGGWNFKNVRKRIMRKELENRYKEAGWSLKVHIDDGLDGPNMSGPDYMILKEAK